MKKKFISALRRLYLACIACVLTTVAAAVTVTIDSPPNGMTVTRGQIVSIAASFSGSVAGVQQVRISGAGDADGFDDVYSYNAFPPKQSGSVSGSYTVPNSATNGQNLAITVTVTDYVDGPVNTTINLVASVSGSGTPPPNDNFANAITISGATGTVTGSNVNATKESGEPNHSSSTSGKSVWWKWTAPKSKRVQIDTKTSGFDTLLGVYTGSSVSALTLVAQNDDGGGSGKSLVSFDAVAGVTYSIAVAGYNGASGTVVLNWLQNVDDVLNIGFNMPSQAFNPVRNHFYGVNNVSRRIEVIDPAIPAVIGNIPLADSSNSIDVSPDGSRLLVSHETAKKLSVIDLNTSAVIMTTSTVGFTSGGPRQLGFISNDVALVGIGSDYISPPLLYNLTNNTLSKLLLNDTEVGALYAGGASTPHRIATSGVRHTGLLNGYDVTYAFDGQPTQTARGLFDQEARDMDAADDADKFVHVNTDPAPTLRVLDKNLNVLLTVTSNQVSQYGYIARALFLPDSRYIAVLIFDYPAPAALKIISSSTGEVLATKTPDLDSFNAMHSIFMCLGTNGPGNRQQIIFVDRSSGEERITFTDAPQVPTSDVTDWAIY